MNARVDHFETFYQSETGLFAQTVITKHLNQFLESQTDQTILSLGHSAPFSDCFYKGTVFAASKPDHTINILCDLENLPFENSTFDRVTAVHALEFCTDPQKGFNEVARVLKDNGAACLILPASNPWPDTPYDQGGQFDMPSLMNNLQKADLSLIRYQGILYITPPFRVSRFTYAIENIAQAMLPFGAAMHIVRVKKTTYAPTHPSSGLKISSFLPWIQKPSMGMGRNTLDFKARAR